jgi:outer membrane lipoprotein-sorting protein
VRLFRKLSTTRLVALVTFLIVIAGGGAALAVAARGGGETPPPKALDQAIHDALAGTKPDGITADITFTNKLFPSGALTGAAGSALLSGATGRLWMTNDGRGRLELQSDAGDVQIVWTDTQVTAYDASSNTVYKFTLPADTSTTSPDTGSSTPPALSEITDFLTQLSQQATVSGAQPDNVGTQPAYTVTVSPKHDGGLLGEAQLAFDAANGVPLRIAIYAQGSSSPALALEATHMTYGAVDSSAVDISPPAGAKVVDLSSALANHTGSDQSGSTDTTGLAATQAAVAFPVAAPDTLVGLPRQHVGLLGTDSALVVYGQGLGAIVVVEHKADTGSSSGTITGLPTVSLNGVTAHELATQLGTVMEWQQGGTSYVLAGSLPPAAAESAARELK